MEHVAAELCREVLSERATMTRIHERSSTVPVIALTILPDPGHLRRRAARGDQRDLYTSAF
jgi:hypothetical protein